MKRKIRNLAFFGLLMMSLAVLAAVILTIGTVKTPLVVLVPFVVVAAMLISGRSIIRIGEAGFAALSADRDTPRRDGKQFSMGVATTKKIFAGSLVMRSATGYATPGATATGCLGMGRAAETVDNTSGADGALTVLVDKGVFRFGNSAAGDAITIADIGNLCFIVDDQTVAKTSGTNTRSIAGRILDVDTSGVWVEFLHAPTPDTIDTANLVNDAVTNAKLANMTRGTVKVGGAADAPTDLDAKTAGSFLKGNGTDVVSTQQILAVVADPGTGVAIPADKSATIHITTAAAETNTLAAPSAAGLILALTMDVRAVGDRVITCATTVNQTGNNTLTFGAAGDTIVLYSVQIGGALRWRVMANDGVALSTV